MKEVFSLIACLVLSSACLTAQVERKLLGAGGDRVTVGTISVHYSIGEVVSGTRVATSQGSTFTSLQGFQQPVAFDRPLPVEWERFTARQAGKRNRLEWAITQLGEEAFFIVERRTAHGAFRELSRVPVPLGTTGRRAYVWYDEDFPPGLLYYRIRQTDADGAVAYSSVELVDRPPDTPEPRLYPNPSSGQVWLSQPTASTLQLTVFDPLGRLVRPPENIKPNTPVNLRGLPAGSYHYLLTGEEGQWRGILIYRP